MALYRALYRKWRPMTFADVVGQEPIVQALQNQVAAKKIGHAYLFTGTRGTGKTTCAKILAKAVNCPNAVKGDPCGKCAICTGVDNGSLLDVIEIDAASNNGVDNIRDLKEEAIYAPSTGEYKVYIVDEVHMLSISAFNALLKILEEPPEHLIFILATTEIQKVPITILSRCQRYDFMRISPEKIAARVQYVAQQEEISITPDAAMLIGQLADGAMRDALSLLDTCAGMGQAVDDETVRKVAGITDKKYLFSISDAVAAQDIPTLVAALNSEKTRSLDTKRLCEELIFHYRNLMLGSVSTDASLLVQVTPAEQQDYLQSSGKASVTVCAAAIRRLGEALEHMTRGANARIELELALFSLAQGSFSVQSAAPSGVQAAPPVKTILPRGAVQPMARNIPQAVAAPAAMETPKSAMPSKAAGTPLSEGETVNASMTKPTKTEASVTVQPTAEKLPLPEGMVPFEAWPQVLKLVKERDIVLSSFMNNSAAYRQGGRVLIDGGELFKDFIRTNEKSHAALKAILLEVTGENLGIGPFVAAESAAAAEPDALDTLKNMGVTVKEI